jgi:hypothetical protein
MFRPISRIDASAASGCAGAVSQTLMTRHKLSADSVLGSGVRFNGRPSRDLY